jgi:hypothetical protein
VSPKHRARATSRSRPPGRTPRRTRLFRSRRPHRRPSCLRRHPRPWRARAPQRLPVPPSVPPTRVPMLRACSRCRARPRAAAPRPLRLTRSIPHAPTERSGQRRPACTTAACERPPRGWGGPRSPQGPGPLRTRDRSPRSREERIAARPTRRRRSIPRSCSIERRPSRPSMTAAARSRYGFRPPSVWLRLRCWRCGDGHAPIRGRNRRLVSRRPATGPRLRGRGSMLHSTCSMILRALPRGLR